MNLEKFIDSRLEPPEDTRELCLIDVYGVEIYKGETYYLAGSDNVAKESIKRYALESIEELTLPEKIELLEELTFIGVLEEIVTAELREEVERLDYWKPIGAVKAVAE